MKNILHPSRQKIYAVLAIIVAILFAAMLFGEFQIASPMPGARATEIQTLDGRTWTVFYRISVPNPDRREPEILPNGSLHYSEWGEIELLERSAYPDNSIAIWFHIDNKRKGEFSGAGFGRFGLAKDIQNPFLHYIANLEPSSTEELGNILNQIISKEGGIDRLLGAWQ